MLSDDDEYGTCLVMDEYGTCLVLMMNMNEKYTFKRENDCKWFLSDDENGTQWIWIWE